MVGGSDDVVAGIASFAVWRDMVIRPWVAVDVVGRVYVAVLVVGFVGRDGLVWLCCGGWDGSVWLCLWSGSWVMARRQLGEFCYLVRSMATW